MRQYVVAALSTVILIGPAEAVDLGVADVQAGGVSAGADVSVSPAGTSLGTGTSLGGLGQVDAGASVATGKSEIGASGSVGIRN